MPKAADPADANHDGIDQLVEGLMDMSSPLDALQQGRVVVYDFKGDHLPDLICDKNSGTVSHFLKEGKAQRLQSNVLRVHRYENLSGIRYEDADVHLLDGEAIKLLVIRFPANAQYVLVRIALRFSWLWGLPGLLRRLSVGQIKLRGIATLKSSGGTQRWLIIEPMASTSPAPSLSSEIGIQGFLDFLREEGVQYVVSRFYEKLPELHRTGGDLDLLVADEDEEKVLSFLSAHPGYIGVDAFTVSSRYFPSPLAAKMVQNGVDGPAGSRVPAPKDAFLSFAYHALYHKGFRSGITSTLPNAKVNSNPDNDYSEMLARMANDLDIQVPIDMESLDEYLHQEGCRPELLYLAGMASGNDWVRRRFMPHRDAAEMGLGVMIFKEKAFRLGLIDSVLEEIERQQFAIIQTQVFDEDGKQTAMDLLRGGNWTSLQGESHHDYLPAMIVVILDIRPYSIFQAKKGTGLLRIDPLKMILRKKFDDEESSIVHATDYTSEAWEYIEVCIPEEIDSIRGKIDEYFLNFGTSPVKNFRFYLHWDFRRGLRIRALRRRGRDLVLRFMG